MELLRVGRGVVSCLAVVLVAGCSATSSVPAGSSSSRSTTGTSTSSSVASVTPTATPTTPQEKALAAYRGMWADMAAAAVTSDYKSALLGRHASGDALLKIKQSLLADKQAGLVTKGQPVLSPRAQAVSSPSGLTRVSVVDCADDSHWLKYRAATGALQDNVPGGRHAVTAQVVGENGSWVVVQFLVRPVGTC